MMKIARSGRHQPGGNHPTCGLMVGLILPVEVSGRHFPSGRFMVFPRINPLQINKQRVILRMFDSRLSMELRDGFKIYLAWRIPRVLRKRQELLHLTASLRFGFRLKQTGRDAVQQ
jgi:hypothetical protein